MNAFLHSSNVMGLEIARYSLHSMYPLERKYLIALRLKITLTCKMFVCFKTVQHSTLWLMGNVTGDSL